MNLKTANATGFSPERPWWSVHPLLLTLLALASSMLAATVTYAPLVVRNW
jgi:hypothetical protein